MDIVKLKKQLIDKIQVTKNNEILEEIQRLLHLQEADETEVYQLNEDQQNAIAEAREDIKDGKVLTDEQAQQDIKEWLRK